MSRSPSAQDHRRKQRTMNAQDRKALLSVAQTLAALCGKQGAKGALTTTVLEAPKEPASAPEAKAYGLPFLAKSVKSMVGHRRFDRITKGRAPASTKALTSVLEKGLVEITNGKDAEYAAKRLTDLSKARCYQRVAGQLGVALIHPKAPKGAKKASAGGAKAKKDWSKVRK